MDTKTCKGKLNVKTVRWRKLTKTLAPRVGNGMKGREDKRVGELSRSCWMSDSMSACAIASVADVSLHDMSDLLLNDLVPSPEHVLCRSPLLLRLLRFVQDRAWFLSLVRLMS